MLILLDNAVRLALAALAVAYLPAPSQAHFKIRRISHTSISDSSEAIPTTSSLVRQGEELNRTPSVLADSTLFTLTPVHSSVASTLPPPTVLPFSPSNTTNTAPTSALFLTSQELQVSQWPDAIKFAAEQTDFTSWAADGGLMVLGAAALLVLLTNVPLVEHFEQQLHLILSTGVFALIGASIEISMGQSQAYGNDRSYSKSVCSGVAFALTTWTSYAWMLLVLLLKPSMDLFASGIDKTQQSQREERRDTVVRLLQAARILAIFLVALIGGLELGWRIISLRHGDIGKQLLLSSAGFQIAFLLVFSVPLIWQLGLECAISGIAPSRQHWYAVLLLASGTLLCIGRAATSLVISAFSESPLGRLLLCFILLSFFTSSAFLTFIKTQQRASPLLCPAGCTHGLGSRSTTSLVTNPSAHPTPNFIGALPALDDSFERPGTGMSATTEEIQTPLSHVVPDVGTKEGKSTAHAGEPSEVAAQLRAELDSLRPKVPIPRRLSSSLELPRGSGPGAPDGLPRSVIGTAPPHPTMHGLRHTSTRPLTAVPRPSASSSTYTMSELASEPAAPRREESCLDGENHRSEESPQTNLHRRHTSGISNRTHLTVTSFFNAHSSPPMPSLPTMSPTAASRASPLPFRDSLELIGTPRHRPTSKPFVPSRLRHSFFDPEDGELDEDEQDAQMSRANDEESRETCITPVVDAPPQQRAEEV